VEDKLVIKECAIKGVCRQGGAGFLQTVRSGFALCIAGRSSGSRVARTGSGGKVWRRQEGLVVVVSKVWG